MTSIRFDRAAEVAHTSRDVEGFLGSTPHDPVVSLEVTSTVDGAQLRSRHVLGSTSLLRELGPALIADGIVVDADTRELIDSLVTGSPDGRPELAVSTLESLAAAVSVFADSVRAHRRTGTALVDSSPTIERIGLLRSWPSHITGRLLARKDVVTVGLTDTGIGIWFADHRRTAIEGIRSFELGVDGAVVEDADGVVHVLDDQATSVLGAVAPEASCWRVRQVPEILAWAGLLGGVQGALGAARAATVDIDVVVD